MEEKLVFEIPKSKRREFETLLDKLIEQIKQTVAQGKIQAAEFAEHQAAFQKLMDEFDAGRKNVEKAA